MGTRESESKQTPKRLTGLNRLRLHTCAFISGFRCESKICSDSVNTITPNHLLHLSDQGLLHVIPTGYSLQIPSSESIPVQYGESEIVLRSMREHNLAGSLSIGNVVLTASGRELARLTTKKTMPGFVEFLLDRWKEYSPTVRNIEPPATALSESVIGER